MQAFIKFGKKLAKSVAYIGAVITALMMFLTVADVLGRRFFNAPIPGAFELTKIGLVMLVMFGLAHAQAEGENIGIEILFDKFPKMFKKILEVLINIISIGLFVVVFLNVFKYAERVARSNQITSVLRIPLAPWIYVSAIGVGFLILLLVFELVRNSYNLKEYIRMKASGELPDAADEKGAMPQ
ncbi:MAG TPA: TRAP transporter small permease [Candidatus Limiplasma sp.]|nr:TRAP transporter small permease [Candidatus Limiplasma sp.]